MNMTCGLIADPLHYHSFTNASSRWIVPTPRDIYIGTFYKCIACHGRLGGHTAAASIIAQSTTTTMCDDDVDVRQSPYASELNNSSLRATSDNNMMLHCIACGVYAHRTCAFARRPRINNNASSFSSRVPICKINLKEIQRAYHSRGMSGDKMLQQNIEDVSPPSHQQLEPKEVVSSSSSSSWNIFGKRSLADKAKDDDATEEATGEEIVNETKSKGASSDSPSTATTAEIEPKAASIQSSSSSWYMFGKKKPMANNEADGKEASDDDDDADQQSTIVENKLSDDVLETKVDPPTTTASAIESKQQIQQQQQQQQQPGVIESSMKLIKKTTETTINIPTASAIGMVAGGAAGWVLAGPAGVIVGSQIGRTVLTVGAVVEGSVGIAMLAMNLANAANFSMNNRSSTSATSNKERELKLNNGILVLVRPDIEVDPIWGEYANEARNAWQLERKNEQASSTSSGFALGNIFSSTTSSKEEPNMRYHKDSDIVKADANELPTRDKVFLLVNRILNDKTSLPGYQYRSLIMKHKRRTMFGDDSRFSSEVSAYNNCSSIRSCRQDAHGVIKHVTATLLEVRPGLASSPAMTELTASAVEALIFGELYDECFDEIIYEKREKDESLVAKVETLRKRCNDSSQLDAGEEEGSTSISHSAIGALQSLPQAHTPTDKLLYCVEFLELISAHYSSSFQEGQNKCIDADSLLAMVCQHVVAANIPHLHAEIAFIEEFSRDEQLLSGKEGYALITLQASLHYLDSLEELPRDMLLRS
ncbi:hypothetical protein ACHAWU_002606 [Discostella pseudostelligera]|uniref:VPS9 domain-containing protein n=1 Tax=Discostella pseudostelligera TaxID=259834 RepID=A0ABD3MP62_9STRA